MKWLICGTLSTLLVSGCAEMGAYAYRPMIDPMSIGDVQQYGTDYEQCRQLASTASQQQNLWGDAAGGAIAGALLGALLGAVSGDAGVGAAYGSVLGMASMAGTSTANAGQSYQQVYRNCMIGRGWRVLN